MKYISSLEEFDEIKNTANGHLIDIQVRFQGEAVDSVVKIQDISFYETSSSDIWKANHLGKELNAVKSSVRIGEIGEDLLV